MNKKFTDKVERKNKRRVERDKGITLIALVVTIALNAGAWS